MKIPDFWPYLLVGLLLVAILSLPWQFADAEQKAISQLQEAGYSQPTMTGVRFFGCSEDDFFRLGFQATGANGKPVTGIVCSAPLKGATIRLD